MKPSIFVVEDDPDISRLVRHHLEADGFAVKVFSSGNTVISESERQRPALFVLDIMVPGKDGLELCRQIRQLPALAATPVIFLTAKSGEADRILGLELGADDYIPKPFSPRGSRLCFADSSGRCPSRRSKSVRSKSTLAP
jgi:DNA-binding response OmpR family regulator